MNQELNNNLPIDVEVQVRLMNLLMGEASDFEQDQLQLMMEQHANVAAYYQHLQHLHGLLYEVAVDEFSAQNDVPESRDAWRLSTDRRNQLLAVFDGQEHNASGKVVVLAAPTKKAQRSLLSRWSTVGILAAAASLLVSFMLLPMTQSYRSVATNFATSKSSQDASAGTPQGYFNERPMAAAAGNVTKQEVAESVASPAYGRAEPADKDRFFRDRAKPGLPSLQSASPSQGVMPPPSVSAPGRAPVDPGLASGDMTSGGMDGKASGGMGGGMGGAEALQRGSVEAGKALRYLAPGSESQNQAYPYQAAIVPAKPGADGRTAGQANSMDSPVAAPASERLGWENGLWDFEAPNTSGAVDMPKFNLQAPEPDFRDPGVTVPDGGSVMQGGIKKSQDQTLQEDAASSTLMMTETPRIIIPEAVEKSNISLERNLNEAVVDNMQGLGILKEDESVLELSLGQSVSPTNNPSVEAWEEGRFPSKDSLDSLQKKKEPSKQLQAVDEQNAATDSFSTFSLHVSDVSFKLAQTALSQGQWPEAARIRIEEFVNALDYRDPLPSGNQQVACRVEQAIHPFLMQRNLLRVSMRTAATGRSQTTPLRLTLLLDNSGSMERPDRRQAVLNAFQTLTQQLSATDQVTLISFANTPRLLAEKVPGNQGETLLKLIENLPSEGGTNIEAALMLAREKATEQLLAGAQNRIVLFTDGAVNLGNANPDSLAKLIVPMRDAGIAFDAAGISAQDLNDDVLEALTRQGDGRYYLLDSAEAVDASFASQIAGALRPSAQNVKVQVEFNPLRVGRYKLLGFEKHRLNQEDFRNDQVDAAELAAAEAGVAVYQLEAKPNGSGDVGSVSVRFLDLETGRMVERRWPIPYEPNAPRLEQATPSMQLAASAALFASKLTGGPLAESVDVKQLQKVLSNLPEPFAGQNRVQQVRSMMDQANAIGE